MGVSGVWSRMRPLNPRQQTANSAAETTMDFLRLSRAMVFIEGYVGHSALMNFLGIVFLGRCPRLVYVGPLALKKNHKKHGILLGNFLSQCHGGTDQ
jgi:hypothetical protein